MSAATVSAVYASALLELADETGQRSTTVAEAGEMAHVLASNGDLLAAIDGGDLSRAKAKELVSAIFAGKVGSEILNLLLLLVDRGRFAAAADIFAEVVALAEAADGVVTVGVTTAVDLDATAQERVLSSLRRRVGDGVRVEFTTDASLIGGMCIRYDDYLVDGSARRQLDDMKQRILTSPVAGVVIEGESA